ncbi:MAG: hypothetical protein Kow0042_19670 [Calditrichia bacterium]
MSIPIIHFYKADSYPLEQLTPATLRERIMAQLIDGFFLGIIVGLSLALISKGRIYSLWISPMIPIYVVQTAADYTGGFWDWLWGGKYVTIDLPWIADFRLAYPAPLQWLIYALYYTLSLKMWGQSPGKMIKKLVVLDEQGRFLTGWKAGLRWLGYLISFLPLGLGFWMSARNPQNQTWHDKMTRTTVWKF